MTTHDRRSDPSPAHPRQDRRARPRPRPRLGLRWTGPGAMPRRSSSTRRPSTAGSPTSTPPRGTSAPSGSWDTWCPSAATSSSWSPSHPPATAPRPCACWSRTCAISAPTPSTCATSTPSATTTSTRSWPPTAPSPVCERPRGGDSPATSASPPTTRPEARRACYGKPQVDVIMVALNFVDHHTYGFDRTVAAPGRRTQRRRGRHEGLRQRRGDGVPHAVRTRTSAPPLSRPAPPPSTTSAPCAGPSACRASTSPWSACTPRRSWTATSSGPAAGSP